MTIINIGSLAALANHTSRDPFAPSLDRHYPPRPYPPRPYPPRPYPPRPLPPRPLPPPPSYNNCYDQEVYLVCKIFGSHQTVRAYTNCGTGYEGDHCYNAEVPGYIETKMNVTFRCEYGRWELLQLPSNGCTLVPQY